MIGYPLDMPTPSGFHTWNRALRGAYAKGWRAAQAGELATACPYQDRRKQSGGLTWSRAFERAWLDGWCALNRPGDGMTATGG